jgi:hypothetical protein
MSELDVEVLLLTGAEASRRWPEMFEDPVDLDDETYFYRLPAHGNATWVDFSPQHVLAVCTRDGRLVVLEDANDWWMRECGFEVPVDE